MESINIFISSPSDVKQERYIAKKVIKDLSRTYSKDVKINAFMWEDMPLLATASFQDGIDYILKQNTIDIAVFILWSRLGTKLGKEIVREDGSRYNSGTEYEYEIMKASFEKSGHPKIIAYVKTEPFKEALRGVTNPEDIKEALSQHDAVKQFIERNFHDKTNETILANHSFATMEEFENQLRIHLKGLIKQAISRPLDTVEWEGNPYVGLNTYSYEEREIFFGRSSFVNEISSEIVRCNSENKKGMVLLLGESGSGKSSIINAGVLPFMLDGLSEKPRFNVVTINPSQFRGNIYSGLVSIIKQHCPFLIGNPVLDELENGIDENYQLSHLQYALRSISTLEKEPILFFDQFEETFCDPLISEQERIQFLRLLRGIVQSHCMWIFITMRNDFYSRFSIYPDFGAVKEDGKTFDMPNLTIDEITRIVEEPAKKVNLKWEDDGQGTWLNNVIVNEAFAIRDLPLIEFALTKLYENRDTSNTITFKIYEEIGCLKGAIVKYADAIYNSLADSQKIIFGEVISQVITCSPDDNRVFVRKTALWDDVAKTDNHAQLMRILVDAHLLKSDKDANGNPTITISHEILLTSWPILTQWLETHKHFIKTNDYYEAQAKYWKDNGAKKRDLLKNETDVNDADYFMHKWHNNTTLTVASFLKSSIKRNRRKWNIALSALDVVLCVFLVIVVVISFKDDSPSHYFGETAFGMTQIALILIGIVISFIYRNWCLNSAKWNKIIFTLWISIFCLSLLDVLFTFLNRLPNDKSWEIWLVSLILTIPTTFSLFNYLIVRRWKNGNFEEIHNDNIVFTNIKRGIRLFILLPTIAIGGLILSLFNSSEAQEKYERALVIATQTLSALDEVNESYNENGMAYNIILDYECGVWDTLSKMLSADTMTVFDYHYVRTKSKAGYPEEAITRFEEKTKLDVSDLFLRAQINFKLNRQHKVDEYLNQYSLNDTITDVWQLTKWAALLGNSHAEELFEHVLLNYSINTQNDSLIVQIIKSQIEYNNKYITLPQFAERIDSIYGVNDSLVDNLKVFVSDYLWLHDIPSPNTDNLQTFLGNDYSELLTTPKDSIIDMKLRDLLINNTWRSFGSYDEEAGILYLTETEFLPADNVFRRKICTVDIEGELNTLYIAIYSYRFKEQDNELLFEHYSFDTHNRLGFVVDTITNDSIVLEQRLPITRKGEKMVLYKLEE